MQRAQEFAVQTGGTAILPCPYEVGRLAGCYFGGWFMNNTKIIEVLNPTARCAAPQRFQIPDGIDSEGRYFLDHSNFSLIIHDAKPSDSSDYRCRLSSVDPVVEDGQTITYGLSVAHSLSVGGKLIDL